MPTAERRRRLTPDARRDEILAAARATVAAGGLTRFSLEDVAREAGVAPSLTRHYFGSRDGLLIAVARQVIEEVVAVLGAPRGGATLRERVAAYLEILGRDPWVHDVWLHAPERSPELRELVLGARRRLAELSFDVSWDELAPPERLALAGWAGYFEAVISAWIDGGLRDPGAVVEALAGAARRLGVSGV